MLVFVHVNRTAGSTVRYILRSSYGFRLATSSRGRDWRMRTVHDGRLPSRAEVILRCMRTSRTSCIRVPARAFGRGLKDAVVEQGRSRQIGTRGSF